MKQIIPINAITAHYHKAGGNDFTPHERNHIPHLAILEIEMNEPKVIQIVNLVPEQDGGFSNPQRGRVYSPDGLSPCIDNMGGGNREPKILYAETICPTPFNHKEVEPAILSPIRTEEQRQLRKQGIDTFGGRQMLPRTDGVSNTITTVQKDNLLQEPIKIRQATAQGYIECPPGGGFDASYPNSKLRRGRVQDNGNVVGAITASADNHCVYEGKAIIGYTRDDKGNVQNYHEREIAGTLHTSSGQGGNTDQFVKESRYRIRKLTPTECLRLMGVDDSDIEKMKSAKIMQILKNGKVKERPMPKTQLYKMAGNSIVVDVLYHIFYQMFIAEPPKPKPIQKSLFDL